ncbi:restriction endonuclease subunit S [Mycoplasma mycoides]|uniref:restriction endonuclease subunit S n=1 Tax=Mycoplasma mycoides TaxID=2102 RepID=UPI00223F72CD|nr:restriction endonuclease subunit S [Mycoplasma mycoides]QVK09414.1 restriction endonuclease subunit S [Mycoplasma mycoides subsp. capri]
MYFLVYIDFNKARNNLKLTNTWEQEKLGDLFNYFNGKSYEHIQSNRGKYELINLNSISIDGGLKSSGKFIDGENKTLLKNDIVMILSDVAHGNLLGKVAVILHNNRYVLNQRVALLRSKSEININFVSHKLNSENLYFKENGTGTSQKNISKSVVEEYILRYPLNNEQSKISSLFSNLDSLITLHQWECNFWKFKNFVFDFLKFSTRFFKKNTKIHSHLRTGKVGRNMFYKLRFIRC